MGGTGVTFRVYGGDRGQGLQGVIISYETFTHLYGLWGGQGLGGTGVKSGTDVLH